ncbi:hypothetical protein QBC37DRAFT_376773 [Rhypophila decipiens]|uniref:Uncharacterized protein n=1 Tax=Rhypophila decipiens TaxID=261697 RepID=A0AAN6Y759_9PEZI|nr:hypothetical protein QBC37DRAFT_376773 [Rhypophila decipiens]
MWKFRERRKWGRDTTPPPIKSKIPGDFPPGWQRPYAQFMEYKVIESLTSQPANRKSVKRAVNQIIRRTSRCLIKIADDFPEEIINVAYHFIPRDPLSRHVLLVWASLPRIASLTPHDKQPILIDFFNTLRKTNA